MRTIASLAGYVATRTEDGIQLHQYLPATLETPLASLTMATEYPLDGAVQVTVTRTREQPWTLELRIPDWCRGATVTVNGSEVPVPADGYLRISRAWQAGDVVAFTVPMPARFTVAHPSVDAVRGEVAIERGPVVYCFESPDSPAGVDLNHVELLVDEPLVEQRTDDLPGGPAVVVQATGVKRDDTAWAGTGWRPLADVPADEPADADRRVTLTAIPYRLWANRGPSVMRIFVPARRSARRG